MGVALVTLHIVNASVRMVILNSGDQYGLPDFTLLKTTLQLAFVEYTNINAFILL